MTTIAEWYKRVDGAWPAAIPSLTYPEAVRAARKLYRTVTGKKCPWVFRETSGRVGTWMGDDGRFHINPAGDWQHPGWNGLIHSLSHYLHNKVGTDKPHSREHARLELRMVKAVVRRGWLTGTLKDRPKTPARAPSDLARCVEAISRWERKAKRAATAMKKLERRRRRLERAAAQQTAACRSSEGQPASLT